MLGAADPATTVWAGLTGLVSLVTTGSLRRRRPRRRPRRPVVAARPGPGARARLPGGPGPAAPRAAPRPAAATPVGAAARRPACSARCTPATCSSTRCCPPCSPRPSAASARGPVNAVAATGLLSGLVVALSPGDLAGRSSLVAVLVGVVGGPAGPRSWRACLPLVGVAAPALLWAGWVSPLRREPRALLLDPVDHRPDPGPAAHRRRPGRRRAAGPRRPRRADRRPRRPGGRARRRRPGAARRWRPCWPACSSSPRWPAPGCPPPGAPRRVAVVAAATGVAAVLAARATGTEPSVPASAAALGLCLTAVLGLRDVPGRGRPPGARGRCCSPCCAAPRATGRRPVPAAAVVAALAVGLLVPAAPVPEGLPSPALVGSPVPAGHPHPAARRARRTPPRRGADAVLAWSVVAGQPGPGQASVQDVAGRPRPARPRRATAASPTPWPPRWATGPCPATQVAGCPGRAWGSAGSSSRDRPDVDTALAQRAGLVRTAQDEDRTTWRVDSRRRGRGPGPGPGPARVAPTGRTSARSTCATARRELPGGGARAACWSSPRRRRASWTARRGRRGAVRARRSTAGPRASCCPADGGTLEVGRPALPPAWGVVAPVALGLLLLALLWPGRRHRARLDLDRAAAPRPGGDGPVRRGPRGAPGPGLACWSPRSRPGPSWLLLVAATGVGLRPGRRCAPTSCCPAALADAVAAEVDRLLGPGAAARPGRRRARGPARRGGRRADLPAARPARRGGGGAGDRRPGRAPRSAASPSPARPHRRRPRPAGGRLPADRDVVVGRCSGGTGVGRGAPPARGQPRRDRGRRRRAPRRAVGPARHARLDRHARRAGGAGRGRGRRARPRPAGACSPTSSPGSARWPSPRPGPRWPASSRWAATASRPRRRRRPRSCCRWVTVPGERGEARLLVGSVGDTPAVVRVRVVPADGAGRPTEATRAAGAPTEPLVAPAGGVVDVDLSGPAAGRPRRAPDLRRARRRLVDLDPAARGRARRGAHRRPRRPGLGRGRPGRVPVALARRPPARRPAGASPGRSTARCSAWWPPATAPAAPGSPCSTPTGEELASRAGRPARRRRAAGAAPARAARGPRPGRWWRRCRSAPRPGVHLGLRVGAARRRRRRSSPGPRSRAAARRRAQVRLVRDAEPGRTAGRLRPGRRPSVDRRVDLLRRAGQQRRDLLDDDLVDQAGQVVVGAGLDRAPVDDEPGRVAVLGREHAAQRRDLLLPRPGVARAGPARRRRPRRPGPRPSAAPAGRPRRGRRRRSARSGCGTRAAPARTQLAPQPAPAPVPAPAAGGRRPGGARPHAVRARRCPTRPR